MPREAPGTGALAGAFALLAAAGFAASSARAQESPDELACSIYEALINEADDFCFEEGCQPTEKQCQKICNDAAKACRAVARRTAKAEDDASQGEARQDQIFCRTAEDPTCRSTVKSGLKDARTATKEFKKDFARSCESGALILQCVSACERQLRCSCVGGQTMNCI